MGKNDIKKTKQEERATRMALRKQRRDQERSAETEDDYHNFDEQLSVRLLLHRLEPSPAPTLSSTSFPFQTCESFHMTLT